jgi:hypothetical protein
MTKLLTVLILLAGIGARSVAWAQVHPAPPASSNGVAPSVAGWTAVGAGAGFGLGLYLGFAAFDQATYAERKITTTAVVTAAAGALGGYLIGHLRHEARRPAAPTGATATARDLRAWMPVSGSFTLRGSQDTGPETRRSIHPGVD